MEGVAFIVGPTAVGKTEVAIELAKRIGGEIISADSMQVYRGMDIGTSKPTPEQRREIPHYLVDTLDVSEEYSCADFKENAERLIEEILCRGKVPIIAGGSGLYVRALVDGLFTAPSADWSLRKELCKEAELSGSERLHERLKEADPATAAKIEPNDLRRIVRALEVCACLRAARKQAKANAAISELRENTKGIASRHNLTIIGLTRGRPELYRRIDQRVEKMFDAGLVSETTRLLENNPSRTALQAIGYKEVAGYLDGGYSLDEAKRLVKRNSRRFAKRQLTWFRPDKRIRWIEIKGGELPAEVAQRVAVMIRENKG